MNIFKLSFAVTVLISLVGCSANSASVKTSTSPIDGKTRTVIQGSDFSSSYIYPSDGQGLGMEISGGSVTDNKMASIVFDATSSNGFREAMFKADGESINLTPTSALTDFNTNEYGTRAIKEFTLSCSKLKRVAQSKDVYLRITFSDGFVDYNVSESKYGADGFAMIRKIASYCQ